MEVVALVAVLLAGFCCIIAMCFYSSSVKYRLAEDKAITKRDSVKTLLQNCNKDKALLLGHPQS